MRTVGLCLFCDNESPAARAVIDHLVRHGEIAQADLPEIATLLGELAMRTLPTELGEELLSAEFVRTTL